MRTFVQILCGALALVFAGCAQLPMSDPVKVSLVGIEQLPGQGLELRMAVKLRVQNPNEAAVDYNGVALDVELRGLSFASGVSDIQGTIPRYGEAVLVVPVSVSAISVLRQALSFANGDRSNVGYAISGKIGGSLLRGERFKSTGQIDLPTSLLGPPAR
ncbi:MAG: LEA type 2 family protein [Burkholderiaceae bacterium]|nr:LEA type 2 family protein [Burkholderiaceae bacterium]